MALRKNKQIVRCACPACRGQNPEHLRHQEINLLLSVMGIRARRMFAAYEAERIGTGGISQMARITGLDRKTIRRGMDELLDQMRTEGRIPGALSAESSLQHRRRSGG